VTGFFSRQKPTAIGLLAFLETASARMRGARRKAMGYIDVQEAKKRRLKVTKAHKSRGDHTFGARTRLDPQTFEEKLIHFLHKQIFGNAKNDRDANDLVNLLQRFIFPTGNQHVDQATTLEFIDKLLGSIVTWQSGSTSNSDPGRRGLFSYLVSQFSNVELTAVNSSKAYLEDMILKIKNLKKVLDLLSEKASAAAMQRFHTSYENHLEAVRQQGQIANTNIPQLTDGTSTGQAPGAIELNSSGLPKERIKAPVDLEEIMLSAIKKAKTKK
jgi:hypothetical protein